MIGRIPAGAAAGTAATLMMSGVMLGARRAGVIGKPAPKHVIQVALDAADVPRPTESHDNWLAAAAHLAYGALFGAAFVSFLRGRRPSVALGAGYGLALALGGYQGWIPLVGILPPLSDAGPGRQAEILGSHFVYGVTLGAVSRRLVPSPQQPVGSK